MIFCTGRGVRLLWVLFLAVSCACFAQTTDSRGGNSSPAAGGKSPSGRFILAGPGVRSAIIIGDQPEYMFPYWGGHIILQRYLMIVTRNKQDKGGVVVPIVSDKTLQGKNIDALYDYRIWIGDQPKVREVLGGDLKKLDDDGFIIRCTGRDLYVCGKFTWGSHWAAYDLLEKFAGCRWYMETEYRVWMPHEGETMGLGDIIPRATTVEMPDNTNCIENPSYKMRFFMPLPEHSFRERYRDRFSHNLVRIMPPATYGREHPEYYPLIGGKRYVPQGNDLQDFQPCISNPQVVDLVANAAKEYFKKNPAENSFSIGMNDTDKYCECPRCQAIAPANITGKEARIAYAFFLFYNQVAEKVAREYPDKRLGCLAYAVLSALPPGSLKINPMIVPYLTRDSAQLFDPGEQKEFRELVDRWSKLAPRMGIYEYIFGSGFIIPRVYNRFLIPNIQNRYGVGVDGFYAECGPNWGLDGPKYWLIDKMLWNNTQDPKRLLDEYYSNMFGSVADDMRQYFDYLEETWCTQTLPSTRSNYRWMNDAHQLLIFPSEKCNKAYDLVSRAEAKGAELLAAEQDPLRKKDLEMIVKRIVFFKTSFAFTRTMCLRYEACTELDRLAGQKDISFAATMAALEKWQSSGSLRKNFEAVAKLKFAISAISGYGADLNSFRYAFDSNPSPGKAWYALSQDLIARAIDKKVFGDARGVRSQLDAILLARQAENPELKAENAVKLLGNMTKESGFLFVRATAKAPRMDGTIDADEWGLPAYSGNFYEGFVIEDRVPYKTTLYAQADHAKLYLAFDCEADTKVMGADVVGRNTDAGAYPKMAGDDAISLNLLNAPGNAQRSVRVNLNGALLDDKSDMAEAKVRRTDKGWQAEIAIKREFVTPWMAIARYYRYMTPDKKIQAAFSTIIPVSRGIGGTVGTGNHDACMCFVWGPRLIFQAPSAPQNAPAPAVGATPPH